jgi:hypothetical protein
MISGDTQLRGTGAESAAAAHSPWPDVPPATTTEGARWARIRGCSRAAYQSVTGTSGALVHSAIGPLTVF